MGFVLCLAMAGVSLELVPPSPTLYINRLSERVNPTTLVPLLYDLFVPFGQILDIVAQKSVKRKGQAFVVFTNTAAAVQAKRALEGREFLRGKPLCIAFAKTPSRATTRREMTH